MYTCEGFQGSQFSTVLNLVNRDGTTPTQFLSSDTLTANLWTGQTQAPVFSPAVSWSSSACNAVAIAITAAEMTTLDYAGKYHMQVTVTRGGVVAVVIDCELKVYASPGSASQLVTPYCSLDDLLEHAPWIGMVQDDDADQEAFYSQRLESKQWLDWLIVRAWRGTSAAYFGDPGRSAQYWLGGWARRSPLPSQWLINQLSGGIVNGTTLTAMGSGYTFATVTFSGGGAVAAGQATASCVISGTSIVSIQLITPGYGYTGAPTITIAGNGTGATALATISANVLMLRPQIVRVAALKAASIVGLGQIGKTNSIANYGAMFRDMASTEVLTCVAELDLNGDGIADLPIPLSVTNTLFT